MKTPFLSLAAACCALALGLTARAEPAVTVDLGLRIGPPPPVVVRRAPPRPIVERMHASPGPGYIWIAGHHRWGGREWVWTPGVWVLPPQPGAAWVESRWDERSQNWVEGYWNVPPPPPAVVTVVEAPPPPRQEIILARPSGRHIWINGYWVWRGRHHEWVAGHWELPPRGRSVWVQPRWERRGGSYVFIEGSWR